MRPFVTQYELACWRNRSEVLGKCSVLAMSFSGAVGRWEVPASDHIPAVFVGHQGIITDYGANNTANTGADGLLPALS